MMISFVFHECLIFAISKFKKHDFPFKLKDVSKYDRFYLQCGSCAVNVPLTEGRGNAIISLVLQKRGFL